MDTNRTSTVVHSSYVHRQEQNASIIDMDADQLVLHILQRTGRTLDSLGYLKNINDTTGEFDSQTHVYTPDIQIQSTDDVVFAAMVDTSTGGPSNDPPPPVISHVLLGIQLSTLRKSCLEDFLL